MYLLFIVDRKCACSRTDKRITNIIIQNLTMCIQVNEMSKL